MRAYAYLTAVLIATLLVNFSDASSLYKRADTQATGDVALPEDAASSKQLNSEEESLDKSQSDCGWGIDDNDNSVYVDIENDGTQDMEPEDVLEMITCTIKPNGNQFCLEIVTYGEDENIDYGCSAQDIDALTGDDFLSIKAPTTKEEQQEVGSKISNEPELESGNEDGDVDPQWIEKVEQQQKNSRYKKRGSIIKGRDLFYFKSGGSMMYDLDMYDESDVFYDESYYDFF